MEQNYKLLTNIVKTNNPTPGNKVFNKLALSSKKRLGEINPATVNTTPRESSDSDSLISEDDNDNIKSPVKSTVNRILLSSSSSNIPSDRFSNRLALSDSDETNCSTVSDSENSKRKTPPKKDLESEMEKLEIAESGNLFSEQESNEDTIRHFELQKSATTNNVVVTRLSQQFDSLNIGQKHKSIYLSGTTISNTPSREIEEAFKNEIDDQIEESQTDEDQGFNRTVISLSSTSIDSKTDENESDNDDEQSIEQEIILISDSEEEEVEKQDGKFEKTIGTENRVHSQESSFHGSVMSAPVSSHIGLSPSVMAKVDRFFNEIPLLNIPSALAPQSESSARSVGIPENLSHSNYVSETSEETSFSSALADQNVKNNKNAKKNVRPNDQPETVIEKEIEPDVQTQKSIPEIFVNPAAPKPSDLVKSTPTDLVSATLSNLTPQSNQKINITAKINIKIHVPSDETSSDDSKTSEENDESPEDNLEPGNKCVTRQKGKESQETSPKSTPRKPTSSTKKIPPSKTPAKNTPTQKTPIKPILKRTPITKPDVNPPNSPRKTPTSSTKKAQNKTVDPYHCDTIPQNVPINQNTVVDEGEPKSSPRRTPRKIKYQTGDPYHCEENQSESDQNPTKNEIPSIQINQTKNDKLDPLFKTPISKSKISKTKNDNQPEAVIDVASAELLDKLYGDAWKTPDLLKKCTPLLRKPLQASNVQQHQNNETIDTTFANDFCKHRENVPAELESTRIVPLNTNARRQQGKSKIKQMDIVQSPYFKKPDLPPKSSAKVDSAGKRNLRQIGRWKRIFSQDSSSSDDGNSEDEWKPEKHKPKSSSDSEYSSSSSPMFEKENQKKGEKKSKKGKSNKVIYFDLTNVEIEIDENHSSPNATAEDLEVITKKFFDSHEFHKNVYQSGGSNFQTPKGNEERKLTNPNTKRKLYTPSTNYDDIEESPARNILDNNRDTIDDEDDYNRNVQLNVPIPRALIPINQRLENVKQIDSGAQTPPIQSPSKTTKKPELIFGTYDTPMATIKPRLLGSSTNKRPQSTEIIEIRPGETHSFLRSLDAYLPKSICHPDAHRYRENFKKYRQELVDKLYQIYNEKVFNSTLDLPISWNNKLTKTAGRCHNRKRQGVRSCRIELSDKVLTSADRVRCTLIHEMCHAAAWIFNEENGHGAVWKKWASRAAQALPELPKINVCHIYDIEYKYTYKCTLCGAKSQAHSKSRKVENIRCAYCHGTIEIFLNKKSADGTNLLTPIRKATGFAKFVAEEYKNYQKPGVSYAEVMKLLSAAFAKVKITKMPINDE